MATATTPYSIINPDHHEDNEYWNNKITFIKNILTIVFLIAGWTVVVGLWSGDYLTDKSSDSFIFAMCGFWLGVIGCLGSWYFKIGNQKQAIGCNFVACLLFIILHYAKVEESTIYWTHGSIMLAGVVHIYLKSISPVLRFVCSIPRLVLRGSMG